jgi:FKBP-type peptidyl-prolyl cis-trans isomerase
LPASQLEQMPGTPAGQVCYEVELLEVVPKQAPPPVPPSVSAPPAAAKQTAGGVSYLVLKPGTGTAHPTARDRVKVNYTGWLASGRLFDSSEVHGQPAGLTLSKATPGFVEGMATMVVGERRRMWIPVEQAYNHAPGSPPGDLVFEVELLEILPPQQVP